MEMSEPTRTYSRDGVTVEWRPERCVHCEACINGLPEVFDMSKRPWVNINGASPEKIKEQVSKCPDKALYCPE
jgi:putative redox protein